MATDIMATSTNKLTHPIRLARSFSFRSSFIINAPRFARRSKKSQMEILRLQNGLEAAKKTAEDKVEALDGIGEDLMKQKARQDESEKSLKGEISALTTAKKAAEKQAHDALNKMNDCKRDTDVYTSEALASQEKFERELENHAEARKALREARSKLGSEENGRVVAEAKLAAVETELAGCESLFNEEKKMLSENVEELEKVVSEKEKECNLLHEQYQNLAAASERRFEEQEQEQEEEGEGEGDKEADTEVDAHLRKELSDVRQVSEQTRNGYKPPPSSTHY